MVHRDAPGLLDLDEKNTLFLSLFISLGMKCHKDSGGVLNQIRGHVYHGLLGYCVSGRHNAITTTAATLYDIFRYSS